MLLLRSTTYSLLLFMGSSSVLLILHLTITNRLVNRLVLQWLINRLVVLVVGTWLPWLLLRVLGNDPNVGLDNRLLLLLRLDRLVIHWLVKWILNWGVWWLLILIYACWARWYFSFLLFTRLLLMPRLLRLLAFKSCCFLFCHSLSLNFKCIIFNFLQFLHFKLSFTFGSQVLLL